MRRGVTRRGFLRGTAGMGMGLAVLPNASSARTYRANEAARIALVGAAGRGLWFAGLLPRTKGMDLVALCDVDEYKAKGVFEKFAKLPRFHDFRVMLDRMDQGIDGVIVATPDNTHAVVSAAAVRHGKAVYTEKPLTHDVHESHVLRKLAREHKVATQMGNQGTSSRAFRRALELIRAGVLGEIREVYVWCMGGGGGRPRVNRTDVPCPKTLHWDLWLGPAKYRAYHPMWMRWQGWRDLGTSSLGGWASHSANLAFMALKVHTLWHRKAAEKPRIRFRGGASEINTERWPRWWTCRWDVPAREGLPAVPIHWLTTSAPAIEQMREKMKAVKMKFNEHGLPGYEGSYHTGCFLIGTKGSLVSNSHNTRFVLLPEERWKGFEGPPETLPRGIGHEREWVRALKGGPAAWSHYDYSGPLNEFLQLGNLASVVPDEDLEYDPLACRIVNNDKADALLRRTYRKGWTL